MPETRFTEFPALPVDPRIGSSRSASEKTSLPALSVYPRVGISRSACLNIFLTYDIKNYKLSFVISFIFDILRRITTISERH